METSNRDFLFEFRWDRVTSDYASRNYMIYLKVVSLSAKQFDNALTYTCGNPLPPSLVAASIPTGMLCVDKCSAP